MKSNSLSPQRTRRQPHFKLFAVSRTAKVTPPLPAGGKIRRNQANTLRPKANSRIVEEIKPTSDWLPTTPNRGLITLEGTRVSLKTSGLARCVRSCWVVQTVYWYREIQTKTNTKDDFINSLFPPLRYLDIVGMFGINQPSLPTPFFFFLFSSFFCACVCFCLYGPFNCISCNKLSKQLSAFSLCSSGLISAVLVLSAFFFFF